MSHLAFWTVESSIETSAWLPKCHWYQHKAGEEFDKSALMAFRAVDIPWGVDVSISTP